MTPQELKNSILQLAIQGKLVEQRPEEGTGEELYQQIQKEKQRLIKEGKIKKEKPLPEITEDEKQFEIPESWKWVRLPTVANMCLGKMLDKQKNKGTLMPYLRNINVRWNAFDLNDLLEMRFDDVEDSRFLIQKGDIVMCEGGEPGRCAIWKDSTPIHFQKALHRIRFSKPIGVEFFYYVFWFYASNGIFNRLFTGTTIKHLTGQSLEKIIVPLPPLSEQKRIVAKIEELLPLLDRYDAAWNKLEAFNKRFPDDLQKSVLQMAMQGKIVEQRPEEGTGEELYQQIQKEKQRLIKEGKIKKEKPLPEITEDEKPFDIPDSWKWVNLKFICIIIGGYAFKSAMYKPNGIRVIRISDFNDMGLLNSEPKYYEEDHKLSDYLIKNNDILMCMTGGTVGKHCILENVQEKMYLNQRVACIRNISDCIYTKYLYACICAPHIFQIVEKSKNSTNDNISMNDIAKFPIPLPPLAEQKRIVEKLEEVLGVAERLKNTQL